MERLQQTLATVPTAVSTAFAQKIWLQYLVVYSIPMLFFLVDKLFALPAILDMFAAQSERIPGIKASGVFLGLLEDFVVTTLLVVVLLLLACVSKALQWIVRLENPRAMRLLKALAQLVHFVVVGVLVAMTLAPFAADMVLLRSRQMRFTMDFVDTYFREKDEVSAVQIDPRELRLVRETVFGIAIVSLVFAVVYTSWIDLTASWWVPEETTTPKEPTALMAFYNSATSSPGSDFDMMKTPKDLEDPTEKNATAVQGDDTFVGRSRTPTVTTTPQEDTAPPPGKVAQLAATIKSRIPSRWRLPLVLALAAGSYMALIAITAALTHGSTPLVAAIALNASLNELFRGVLDVKFVPTPKTERFKSRPGARGSGSGPGGWAASYLESDSEKYTLFDDDVLYRRTTGFTGPLAFDVEVKHENPPNVLVLAIESFRYLDSLYLAGDTAAGAVLKTHNLSLTPNFDRWAKRGVALSNLWSSWQTSRSLEAILFGQVTYDSVTDTGTTRGRKTTKLEGMPQLFKQKNYETVFTTGCTVEYDQWDSFLPSHGFDTVLGAPEFKAIAEKDYSIAPEDWDGPASRGFYWGVHDDLSFAILGDLLVKKMAEQKDRQVHHEDKKPFFHNHYTITSHTPYNSYPAWFAGVELPDFSPLCDGQKECDLIKQYATLRYFTDLELGKFLDRMDKAGVLKDTIVVLVGDHGQSPEFGTSTPYTYETATTHVAGAILAEGRLGKHAGLVIDDATHQYDLLNTIADIVGVPEGGFLQTSVGRSLKREIPFGERLVWSNNPMKKMSVVRGHERFVYDRVSNEIGLFDTINDPLEGNDLLPSRSKEEVADWKQVRAAGRAVSAYFTKRWDGKCLTQVAC